MRAPCALSFLSPIFGLLVGAVGHFVSWRCVYQWWVGWSVFVRFKETMHMPRKYLRASLQAAGGGPGLAGEAEVLAVWCLVLSCWDIIIIETKQKIGELCVFCLPGREDGRQERVLFECVNSCCVEICV